MAILSKTGITTGNTVESGHVTQSIDAFSGIEQYDIFLSGSFNMTGSINGEPGVVNNLTASNAITASRVITADQTISQLGRTYFPVFVDDTSAGPLTTKDRRLFTDSSIFTYSPSTNLLTVTSSFALNATYTKVILEIDSGTITGSISSGSPFQLLPSPTPGHHYDWYAFIKYTYGSTAYNNSGGGYWYVEQGGAELSYGFNLNGVTSDRTWKAVDGSGGGANIGPSGWETGSLNLKLNSPTTLGNGSITASVYYRQLPL